MIWVKTDAGRAEMQDRALVKERARRNLLLLIDGIKSEEMLLANLAGITAADFQELSKLDLIAPAAGAVTVGNPARRRRAPRRPGRPCRMPLDAAKSLDYGAVHRRAHQADLDPARPARLHADARRSTRPRRSRSCATWPSASSSRCASERARPAAQPRRGRRSTAALIATQRPPRALAADLPPRSASLPLASLPPGGVVDACPPAAARHVQVLRLQPGDALVLFNGSDGAEWPAEIVRIGRRDVERARSARRGRSTASSRCAVTLALGVPANERMDALVEKATELGAAAIQPLVCERSVRAPGGRARRSASARTGRRSRSAASEQCGRTRVPRSRPVASLAGWLEALRRGAGERRSC